MNRRNPAYIARWRTAKGITQEVFAKRIGLSKGVLSGIERGLDPRWSYLVCIAAEMKIGPVELLYRVGLIEREKSGEGGE